MADSRAEARKFKMNLEHLVLESMEVLKKQENEGKSMGHNSQPDRIYNHQSWGSMSNKITVFWIHTQSLKQIHMNPY